MGKIKKAKSRKSVAKIAEELNIEDEPIDSRENVIQTIIDQLQTTNIEEKYCGLQTLALLIENNQNIEALLSNGLVRIVAPLMLDSESSIRNAASGALRNLSTSGHDVCDALLEQDIMTPLVAYFHEHAEGWPVASSKTKVEDKETFVHCIYLLLNLCESSEIAVKYLLQSRIFSIFLKYLELTEYGSDIVIPVLQCLCVVLEDNPQAIEKIRNDSERQLEELMSLSNDEPSFIMIKTLSAGVIVHMHGGVFNSMSGNIIHRILTILADSLKIDHRQLCNKLSSIAPLQGETTSKSQLKNKETSEVESQTNAVSFILDAQQSAIEIIANICSCDVDDTVDGSSDSEDMDDELCNGNTTESSLIEDKLPSEVLEAMIALEIFDKVWAKTQPPADNVMMILKEYEGTSVINKKILDLQARSLLCVNNMLSTLPIENLGGANRVYKIWVDSGKLVFKQESNNFNLLESATAVMRAALDKMKFKEDGNIDDMFNDLALSDIEMMVAGIRECQVPEIRSNLIRMIGLLALLLVNKLSESTTKVICAITNFIIDQAYKENEVWVLAEAVDTLVDLYSEDETDALAANVKLIEKLSPLGPVLKNKARQQKKLPKEYKVLVSTATSNLPRFIKYKRERLAKLA